jgi:RHS repeat-associated protein
VTLRQRIDYGDGGDPAQPAAERAAAAAANLLGRPVRHHDEAGLVTTKSVDLLGNVLSTLRQLITDAAVLATYQGAATNGWRVTPFQVEWTPSQGQTQDAHDATLLEPAAYVTTTAYDALSRVTGHTYPTDVTGQRQVLSVSYNRSGGVDQVRLGDTVHVSRIAYDAKGQRSLVAYGNGVMTRYAYDRHTFRVVRMRSEPVTTDGLTYRPSGPVLQDHGYDYDLVGNVLRIRDRTPGSGIRNNPDALTETDPDLRKLLGSGDALNRRFGYDPLYRLLSATGREFGFPPTGDPWLDSPRGTDLTQAKPYQEAYGYDAAGGLANLAHFGDGGFTRVFTTEAGNDRLHRLTSGKTSYDYTYDANGNMTGETASRHFFWNHADRLKAFATQTAGAEPSVHAQYLYDANGERVKKFVRRQGGSVEVTHYLGEMFEHHRWTGVPNGENNHLHLMDDRRRIALVRAGAPHPDDHGPAVAVQFTDHLGSSTAVLDGTGVLTNREEYTPYGETSFGSHTRKRYRFIGKERDEESSLVGTSARLYSPWTARWASCEPHGGLGHPASPPTGETLNSYWYARANPLRFVDTDGRDPTGAPDQTQKVPPVLGSDAHRDILPELVIRLALLGYVSQAEVPTAPGGSLSGISRGRTDLVVHMLEEHAVVGHVYELKPARLVGSADARRQVGKYVRYGQKLLFPGNPLFYTVGTALDDLTYAQKAALFAPVVVARGAIVRTYALGLIRDVSGNVVPGQIGYSFADIAFPVPVRQPQERTVPVRVPEPGVARERRYLPWLLPPRQSEADDYSPALTREQKLQAARNTATTVTVGAVLLMVARFAILAL